MVTGSIIDDVERVKRLLLLLMCIVATEYEKITEDYYSTQAIIADLQKI